MWAVVGLGNPGPDYAGTRHNAGFLFVQRTARAWGVSLGKRRFQAKTAEATRGGEKVLLALPQTFMNCSGRAARALMDWTRLPSERLVVVTDDVDLAVGRIRVRKSGGPGTHKGMASVVREIGTTAFPRIRIGIGPCPEGQDLEDFVLRPFRPEERELVDRSLERAGEALDLILAGRIEIAMTAANRPSGGAAETAPGKENRGDA